MSNVLVVGSNGQLGRSLAAASWPSGLKPILVSRKELDLTDPVRFAPIMQDLAPAVVVNAAAYTAVDKAEGDPDSAMAVNARGAGLLAEAAAAAGVPIIHISTDYVFDGAKPSAYRETDSVRPLNVYGASKLEGELRVRAANPQHVILRTSWVYSPFGNNFVLTMLRLSRERDQVRVVSDQLGTPTAAGDLANAVIGVALVLTGSRPVFGTYHVAGGGETTWHGFADAIFSQLPQDRRPRLTAISSSEYPTPAQRPANSRLDSSLFGDTFGISLPHWRMSLGKVLAAAGEARSS